MNGGPDGQGEQAEIELAHQARQGAEEFTVSVSWYTSAVEQGLGQVGRNEPNPKPGISTQSQKRMATRGHGKHGQVPTTRDLASTNQVTEF